MKLSKEDEIFLNKLLPFIPKRTGFSITQIRISLTEAKDGQELSIADVIEVFDEMDEMQATEQDIQITEYLQEEDFAEPIEFIANPFNKGNPTRPIMLNENGRLLKKLGNVAAFDEKLASDKRKAFLQDQRESHAYYIQLLLMIWTGIAAVYYVIEILKDLKYSWTISINLLTAFFLFASGLLAGITILLITKRY